MNKFEKLRLKLNWVLDGWETDVASVTEVHYLSEKWLAETNWTELSHSDPYSAVAEILSQLDILNQQLITAGDIPAMRRFIEGAQKDSQKAWKLWEGYWKNVDFESRRKELAGNKFYAC